jgi:hypothetical protein
LLPFMMVARGQADLGVRLTRKSTPDGRLLGVRKRRRVGRRPRPDHLGTCTSGRRRQTRVEQRTSAKYHLSFSATPSLKAGELPCSSSAATLGKASYPAAPHPATIPTQSPVWF